jgi:hypothetical protein
VPVDPGDASDKHSACERVSQRLAQSEEGHCEQRTRKHESQRRVTPDEPICPVPHRHHRNGATLCPGYSGCAVSVELGECRGTLALFLALGGASGAALSLPRNSVGTAQLRNGSVTLPVDRQTGLADLELPRDRAKSFAGCDRLAPGSQDAGASASAGWPA